MLNQGLLVAMQTTVASATKKHSATPLADLLGELELGLRVMAADLFDGKPPDSITAERQILAGLRPAPMPPASPLPAADDAVFLDYLQARLDEPALRIDRIDPLSGGFSRTTLAVDCTAGTAPRSIILRKEIRGGLLEGIGASVAEEYPMLVAARAGGVPIPKPLWLETDPTILGGAFIAMDRVKGYCLGTSVGARERVPESHLKSLAATLAKLHSLQWRDASPALPEARGFSRGEITAASALAGLLDRWRHYRQIATNDAPSPILDAGSDWLKTNAPTSLSDPCITHGDVGFHNIMGDEQGFTALLDWETACLASPAKDLAHVRPAVLPHVDWSLFLQWYCDAGGPQVPAAEIKWFEVFRAFSMTLVCQVAIAKLRQPETARLEYLQLGYLVQPVMFDQLRELIED